MTTDQNRLIERLERCLDRVRQQWKPGRWATEALALAKQLDSRNAAAYEESLAMCHLELGRDAFLAAERVFWKGRSGEDSPYLSVQMVVEEEIFAPASAAMMRRRSRGAPTTRPSYATARAHFERAISYDPYRSTFYLGMIALRGDDFVRARAELARARSAPPIRGGKEGAVERGQLRRAAATCEGVAALLQGDLDAAAVALTRASRLDKDNIVTVRNQGFLCERRGEFHEATKFYRTVLQWEPADGFALHALARVDERASIIKLRHPRDFHLKFTEIADALRIAHGHGRRQRPLPARMIDQLRLASSRGSGRKHAVPIPESMKTILRYDRDFALWKDGVPLLRKIVSRSTVVPSASIDLLVRGDGCPHHLVALKKLPRTLPVWNDDPELPACIPLTMPRGGTQDLFIYMGHPDESGEYPIARYEDQPELWIEEASLIHLVIAEATQQGVPIECAFDLDGLKKKAQKRNAMYREGLSDHPLVRAIVDA